MDFRDYDRHFIWHPYASLKNPPRARFVREAQGLELILDSGERLIDGVASWWCVAHGHNHPAIVDAIRTQSAKMCHVMFGGLTHEPAVRLAQKLAVLAPAGLDRVFFSDSGSISVEVAVKMAIQYQVAKGRPRRSKMLALKGGYHGDTACAMALSDPDGMHTLFSGMMPKHFFAEKPGSPDDIESQVKMVEEHKDELAGIICEPVLQAANAMNFYSPEYLKTMRELADANDLVLVFDEIAAGLHRLGPRWAASFAGVTPDVMTVGKALTGGHITLAATLASGKVADTISNGSPGAFMHGPTYMANPLACAAACASLDLFLASDYAAKTASISDVFSRELEKAKNFENVTGVRGLGAAWVIEVERLPSRDDIDRVIAEHGVWLRPFSNFIYAMPPLVADAAACRRIAGAMLALAACPPGPADLSDFHE